jgi:signal peptidase II
MDKHLVRPTTKDPESASGQPLAPTPISGIPKHRAANWYRDPLLLIGLTVVLGLDQLTKWLITSNLILGQSFPVDGFFRFTYIQNSGSAFGLFQGRGTVLTIISCVAVVLIIILHRSTPIKSIVLSGSLGLILGGTTGNLIDRFRLGSVVDFIDVGPWPIFNVADSSIVVGMVILMWYFSTGRGTAEESSIPSSEHMVEADGENTKIAGKEPEP